MTSHIERLGRRLADVEEGLKRVNRSNNLSHSSFDGGSIQQNGEDGTPGSVFGVNFDGTNGVVPLTSPPPPTPKWTYDNSGFDPVTGIIGGIRVRWSGEWENFAVAPLGFASIEVHVSDTPNFSALLFDTMKTSIVSPRGGEVVIPLVPGTYYVRLVCRTTAGRAGAPSVAAGPVTATAVTREDLGFDIDALAGNKVFRGSDTPVGTTDAPLKYGDLWLKTPDNVAYQFAPPDPGSWVKVQDQNIVKALNDAADAAGLANAAGLSAGQAKSLASTAQGAADAAAQTAAQANSAAKAASDAAALAQSTASGKVTVYRQTSAPTGGTYVVNDLWLDTSHNNQLFAWTGGAWVASDDQRIATALTNASSAQSVAGAKTTLFAQISAPATTGRVVGDTWIDTDDSNKVYVWTGTAWTATLFGAGAIGATARQLGAITIYRQTSAPTTGMVIGDYWLDSANGNKPYLYQAGGWVLVQDAQVVSALTNAATAQATADGKARIFYQTSAPTGLVAGDLGDSWVDTDDSYVTYTWDGAKWVKNAISTSSFQPNSLVVSTVAATGSITAALLESVLVLASTIIGGDAKGDHAKMDSVGFHVFAADPTGGAPIEVIRMGTQTNDFFGIVDSTGMAVASIDDTGRASFSGLSVNGPAYFKGRTLDDIVNSQSGGLVGHFAGYAPANTGAGFNDYGPIRTRVGFAEVNAYLVAGRQYMLKHKFHWSATTLPCEVRVQWTYTTPTSAGSDSAPAPTVNSVMHDQWVDDAINPAGWRGHTGETAFIPTITGRHRFLMSIERGVADANSNIFIITPALISLNIEDIGVSQGGLGNLGVGGAGLLTQGGGAFYGGAPPAAPPPPVQSYYVELPPTGAYSVRGDGSFRSDTTDVVQGWDPSGYNGDQHGYWTFNLPPITGTVNRVDIYAYSNHWYYHSGGTAIWNIIRQGDGGAGINGIKLASDQFVGGYASPGGVTWTVPSGWLPSFASAAGANRALGVSLGPSGGSNLAYYGRFNGPDTRLRIWYTQ